MILKIIMPGIYGTVRRPVSILTSQINQQMNSSVSKTPELQTIRVVSLLPVLARGIPCCESFTLRPSRLSLQHAARDSVSVRSKGADQEEFSSSKLQNLTHDFLLIVKVLRMLAIYRWAWSPLLKKKSYIANRMTKAILYLRGTSPVAIEIS